MTTETQARAIENLDKAIEELTYAREMLKNGTQPISYQPLVDKIFDWLGTGTGHATQAKNAIFEETTYKDKLKELLC